MFVSQINRNGLYCFHIFVILEILTVQVSSTISVVLMTSNKIGTTRLVVVETRNA
jgi:hypothetical protein